MYYNVSNDERNYILTMDVPGCKLDVQADEATLVVRAERGAHKFTKTFALPYSVNTDAITADYIDGVLTLYVPKRAKRTVPIALRIKQPETSPQLSA